MEGAHIAVTNRKVIYYCYISYYLTHHRSITPTHTWLVLFITNDWRVILNFGLLYSSHIYECYRAMNSSNRFKKSSFLVFQTSGKPINWYVFFFFNRSWWPIQTTRWHKSIRTSCLSRHLSGSDLPHGWHGSYSKSFHHPGRLNLLCNFVCISLH